MNEFVVEYAGQLKSGAEGEERLKFYEQRGDRSFYLYFFHVGSSKKCIDATKETPRLGRLINHSRDNVNCMGKMVFFKNEPTIVFFATRFIQVGEEILYHYRDKSINFE